jgi:hypothetical protein
MFALKKCSLLLNLSISILNSGHKSHALARHLNQRQSLYQKKYKKNKKE